MELSPAETAVMQRFFEKARIAGGPRAGYMLRKQAITYHAERSPEVDFEAALAALVERDLLKVDEGGKLFYLTEAGVTALAES